MKQRGSGILNNSEIYFSSPSLKEKKLFYNVLCAGHFFCDEDYNLKRERYDSFLILHVLDGTFTFIKDDMTETTAHKGDTVLIDCYKPHAYFTRDKLESVWVHISGANSDEICKDIISEKGNIVRTSNTNSIQRYLFRLLNALRCQNLSQTEISIDVYKLILCLAWEKDERNGIDDNYEDNIKIVKDYVSSHINENLTVTALADLVHMSATHFSRVFKKKSGFSPYAYVMNVRLNKAKELLLKPDMSIAEIAYETGFNSEANFVYCFTKNEGISPGKFRKTGF